MKRALAILFAVVLVFAALPVSAAEVDESNLQVRVEFDGDAGGHTVEGDLNFVDGIVGQAAQFSGGESVILNDASLSGDQYAVALWVNPVELTHHTAALFAHNETGWTSLVPLGHNDELLVWSNDYADDWFDGTTGTVLEADTWTHLAYSVNGSDITIYVNGESVGTHDSYPNFISEGSEIIIGNNSFEADSGFNGLIDDVLIFDAPVSGDVIADYYASATGDAPEADEAEADEEAPEADEDADEDEEEADEEEGTTLPETATNQFTFLLVGALLVLISGGFLLVNNRVSSKEK